MSSLGRFCALAALALVVFLVVGCGETVIDSAKTEGAIEENLEKSIGQKVSSVDCPSGVKVEAGKTFDCTVSLENGKKETATLKILNSDADVEVTDLKPASGK
jgi:NAD(P)H-hydrate repair Nnr-like enzyme with NAD(P)H-hydrate epimerase domain